MKPVSTKPLCPNKPDPKKIDLTITGTGNLNNEPAPKLSLKSTTPLIPITQNKLKNVESYKSKQVSFQNFDVLKKENMEISQQKIEKLANKQKTVNPVSGHE